MSAHATNSKLTPTITLFADELEKRHYYGKQKSLIEYTYKKNDETKMTLMAHSMGGLVSLHFLTGISEITREWKDKYIHCFIPLAGAWDGGVSALQLVISGHHNIPKFFPFKNILGEFIVPTVRTFESTPFLIPSHAKGVLVKTPTQQYRVDNLNKLFKDIGYNNGFNFYRRVQSSKLRTEYPAPNVPTYAFYGVGVDTPEELKYSKDFSTDLKTI